MAKRSWWRGLGGPVALALVACQGQGPLAPAPSSQALGSPAPEGPSPALASPVALVASPNPSVPGAPSLRPPQPAAWPAPTLEGGPLVWAPPATGFGEGQGLSSVTGPMTLLVGQSFDLASGPQANPITWRLSDPEASAARLELPPPLVVGSMREASGTVVPITEARPWRLVGLRPGAVALTARQGEEEVELWVPLLDPAVQGQWLHPPYDAGRWPWSDRPRVIRSQAELDQLWQQAWGQARRLLQSGPAPALPFPESPMPGPTGPPPPPEGPQVAFPVRQVLLVPRPAGEGDAALVAIEGLRIRLAVAVARRGQGLAPSSPCPPRPGEPRPAGPDPRAGRVQAFVVPALPEGEPVLEYLSFPERGSLPQASPAPAASGCP